MSKWKKVAAVAAPVVMAFSAPSADAKVLLMGDGGWEVSFDGLVNGFYSYSDVEKIPNQVTGYSATRNKPAGAKVFTGQDGASGTVAAGSASNSYSAITTGLLPVVWGVNIKAPTTNGLDMSARLGIYPQIQNGHTKNNFGAQAGAKIDLREAFFEVGGSFGSVLVGRTLSLYQGKNILTDMTLFGVGAPNDGGAGTTLGRIGFGYVYPNFNAGIRYSTPDINGFKVSGAIYQPSQLKGGDSKKAFSAGVLETPRFEGEVSFATDLSGASLNSWFSGMFQKAETRATPAVAAVAEVQNSAMSNYSPARAAIPAAPAKKIEAWGTAAGLQVGIQGLNLTASGYWGEGLGSTLMLDSDGFDREGKGRRNVGYLGQATYAFGQGTSVGASYGINRQFNTSADTAALTDQANVMVRDQSLIDVMLWHDINSNLRVVGEWSQAKATWQDGADVDTNTFSVGGFFFW